MDLTPHDIASTDPAYWANLNAIKLAKGCFTFKDRDYLIEPMQSLFKRITMMKGTQGGASLIVMLKMLWGMIYKRYEQGVLYLMPTTEDIQEFSKSKFGPMIMANPESIGKYLSGTDTAALKTIGTSQMFMRSGTLSRKIDIGYDETGRLKGISVDAVVFDEIEIMDSDIITKAKGRMGDSDVSDEIYIGNPGTPNRGIDALYNDSDQRYWWMICRNCGAETCAEREFFDDPSFIKVRDDGSSFLGCKQCGKQISNYGGKWVPDVPSKSLIMHGYRWSQLIIPRGDSPAQILHDFRYPPQDNIGDVLRTKLGMAWISSENQLTKSQVYACCGDVPQLHSHAGPCAMGIDIGDVKHYVVGIRTGTDTYKILRLGHTKSLTEISDVAKRFNVKSSVMDVAPHGDAAREFQRKEHYTVWLCSYSETTPLGTIYNSTTGLVKPNRTEIFDQSGRLFQNEKVVIPRKEGSSEIVEFVKQVTDPVCIEEIDKRTRKVVRRYRGKNDHYRNAMNYFCLAAGGGKLAIASKFGPRQRQTHSVNEYARV